MGNITYSGQLDLQDLKYLPEGQPDKYLLRDGDVLFNRTNSPDLVGKTATFRGSSTMAYAGYLVRLRTSEKLNPDYLTTFMNLSSTKQLLRNMCKSIVGMANINAKEVQTIRLPVPQIELQQRFATRVAAVERLKEVHRQHLAELDTLFASLQHRAFKGEL
jgi:type I restriction enzyme S subunit